MTTRIILLYLTTAPLLLPASGPPGPVARYEFNTPFSSSDIVPEEISMPGVTKTADRFNNAGCAVYLHGSQSSYINLGKSEILKPENGTISLWFKMENVVYSGRGYKFNPILLTKCHDGDDFYEAYSIGFNAVTRKLSVTTALGETDQLNLTSSAPIALNSWYHVAVTYDDQNFQLYLNGDLQGSITKNFRTIFLAEDSVMIGNSANQKNSRYFNGAVDDIYFYDRVLSAEEILDLYNAPNPNRFHVAIKWFTIVSGALLAIGFLVILLNRRHRRDLFKLRQQHEMEMRVMRAQMNPHFIFNAMNSVQQLILAGSNDHACQYLGTFSKLLRRTLESNGEEFICLDHEIDILTRYIELESLRFNQSLKYEIITDANVVSSQIKIPQMLIQPLVENAIWHGLLPRKSQGLLTIRFASLSSRILSCTIDDNGVGRGFTESSLRGLSKTSLATEFINERLSLMKKAWGGQFEINYLDKTNAEGDSEGTCVTIKIPIMN